MNSRAVALIVAAGRGERLGSDGPKALVMLGGRPMLDWSIDALRAAGLDDIIVALPGGVSPPDGTRGVEGGSQRSHSVRNALAAADPGTDVVLVHDAARPLVTAEIVRACLDGLGDADAAIAAAPVSDTVKEAGEDRVVAGTLDRSRLWAVQTPQVFRRQALIDALAQPEDVLAAATDDASLVEALGGTVTLVETPRWNFKITTAEDLAVAERLVGDVSV